MSARSLVSLTEGTCARSLWLMAARQEPSVRGKPKACKACPLRVGGEWEKGASDALAVMTPRERGTMRKRWGCHAESRPCAGMTRLVEKAGNP